MIELIVASIVALIIGGLLAWVVASSKLKQSEAEAVASERMVDELRGQVSQRTDELEKLRVLLEREKLLSVESFAKLDEAQRGLEAQKVLLKEMEDGLSDKFKSLSMEALTRNTDELKKFADSQLKTQAELGKRDLEGKKELIDNTLESMGRKLSDVQKKVEDIGHGSMEKLSEVSINIKNQTEITHRLMESTDGLRQTLASSKKRGEWGERMAEDVIRLAGLIEGINYQKQKTLEHSGNRPDYTFFLPNKLKINMDVKFPLDNYANYLEADSDAERKKYRDELVRSVKLMIKEVTKRDYINPTDHTVDYVIVFIPNEQVYSFLLETDMSLMDESLRQKVILCSPFTLYAVLAVVRQAVDNFNLEQTASEILRELGKFSLQWQKYKERFEVLGNRIEATRKEYDNLNTTRTNQLERPLNKIESIRVQESIDMDGEEPQLELE